MRRLQRGAPDAGRVRITASVTQSVQAESQVTSLAQGAVGLIVAVALATAGYLGARHWQDSQGRYERVGGPADCDLRAGPCRRNAGQGVVALSLSPPEIPLMTTLTLQVTLESLSAQAVFVDIRGLNMDMGLNRTRLQPVGGGRWQGETILPVCSQRRMEWEAAVLIEAPDPLEVPFPFYTTRP